MFLSFLYVVARGQWTWEKIQRKPFFTTPLLLFFMLYKEGNISNRSNCENILIKKWVTTSKSIGVDVV